MNANNITAVAAVALVAMGAYALYYNSDSAKEARQRRREELAVAGVRRMADSIRRESELIDWSIRIGHEAETAAGIRFIDSATARRCTRVTDVEADADLNDLLFKAADSVYDHRIRSYSRGHGGNAVLVTARITKQGTMTGLHGDSYKCPD